MVEPGAGLELEGLLAQSSSRNLTGEGFDQIGNHDEDHAEFSHFVSPPETNLFDAVSNSCNFNFQFL
eukprot:747064-Hanusia_phi.AAC.2